MLAAAVLLALPARGDDDRDRAMEALERSEILPLAQLLPQVELRTGAHLLAVEFFEKDGRYLYEFEFISPDGRMSEIVVDASTGAIVPESQDEESRE